MIGACSLLRHRPQDDVPTFKQHWLGVHGPLAAQLQGVKRYLQSHFDNESPATNDAARALNVDGLAEMWFENEADRERCYASEQEKVCDVDSLLFIGATARVVSEVIQHVPLSGTPARYKQVFLVLEGQAGRDVNIEDLTSVGKLRGLTEHRVTKPGAEVTQRRERVMVSVRRIITAASDEADDIERVRALITDENRDPAVAVFQAVEYYLI